MGYLNIFKTYKPALTYLEFVGKLGIDCLVLNEVLFACPNKKAYLKTKNPVNINVSGFFCGTSRNKTLLIISFFETGI